MDKKQIKQDTIRLTLFLNLIIVITYAFCILFPKTMDIFNFILSSIIFLIVIIAINYLMFRTYKIEIMQLETKQLSKESIRK